MSLINIQDLFCDELELTCFPRSYDEYKILSVNGIEPRNEIIVWYYYDQLCLPFDDRIPGLRGKLCICVKGDNGEILAGGEARFFNDWDAANSYGMGLSLVEEEEAISVLDLLTWALQCSYPNGNHVEYAVNDFDECQDQALEILGVDCDED